MKTLDSGIRISSLLGSSAVGVGPRRSLCRLWALFVLGSIALSGLPGDSKVRSFC